jgi:hypothetical protein
MKKFKIIFVFLFVSGYCFGQENESSTRIFISQATYYQINKDWNITAEFNTGTDDNAKFFPIEVINLKTMEKQRALQIDMYVKILNETLTAYVGYDEIDEFIIFLEKHVIPNMASKFKKKSSEYRFIGKEMVFSYLTDEKHKTVTIVLKQYEFGIDDKDRPKFQFFSESQSDEIIKLLNVLKILA